MQCQFCGAEIPAGDQFCGRCGARAPLSQSGAAAPAPSGSSPGAEAPSHDQPATPPPSPQAAQPWQTPYFGSDANAMSAYRYAGFGVRFGAWLLDSVFVSIPAIPVGIVLGLLAASSDSNDGGDGEGFLIVGAFMFGVLATWFVYTWIFTAMGGGPGKKICGIRIVMKDTGALPGWGTGALRPAVIVGLFFVPVINSIAQLVDHLWMLWDNEKQTIHDKAAGTVVVHP